ncbi:MAG: GNAT family N-acetyltransferase [Alphaproteobacteria bacterium]|nr:GNAT family N-acetyltransferase [Alphaproteobacteria bacterium]
MIAPNIRPKIPTEMDLGPVRLRRFTPDDVPAYAEIRGHPEVSRWLPPLDQFDPDRDGWEPIAADTIARGIADWDAHGFGRFAVEDKETGRLLGHHGIRYMSEFESIEILYGLHPDVHGRGIATMIARHMVDLVFGTLDQDHVIAIALPDNKASRRVMEKAGLTFRKMSEYRGFAVAYYRLDRDENRNADG